ncbi:hypothetical protein WISP_00487 [Willisornis vidua]|uniref:Uncharacterized protein n=1 Tax=Willisornis vidua TaxID=1566151 RepID=A0ABQ9DWM3_9PASS|nr:hypothetical protein WISP_00487 [Willisornis vidua]
MFSDPQEFILSCLTLNPDKRPTANNLLFHRVLFEVHSLKLLAAHCFINHQCECPGTPLRCGLGGSDPMETGLGELGMSSLEKRRLWGDLRASSST